VSELEDALQIALKAADIARDVIMPLYHSGTPVELKADRTPVTAADRGAEEAIRAFLERECPAHGVLGEELGETPGDGRHRWILDPIDGTKSFIHRVPLFGTLIALERDGIPVVGVIACHAAGETAYAAQGHGAFVNGSPAHVSTTESMSEATISMTSYSRLWKESPAAFAALAGSGALMRAWGDCYGYLLVASGRADVMLDPEMNLWDVAALYPIITEAGGRLTTWDGSAAVGGSAVATNGVLHDQVMNLLHGRS
jgi:histidinol phosphatase-like enzyme (inositol monophosphatase family)